MGFADLPPELFEQILVRCDLRQVLRCKAVSNYLPNIRLTTPHIHYHFPGVKIIQRIHHHLSPSNLPHQPLHLRLRRDQTQPPPQPPNPPNHPLIRSKHMERYKLHDSPTNSSPLLPRILVNQRFGSPTTDYHGGRCHA